MNLLAQALVCLTDPDERAIYDRARGTVPVSVAPSGRNIDPPESKREAAAVEFALPESVFDIDEAKNASAPEGLDATIVLEIPFTVGLEPPLGISDEITPEKPFPGDRPASVGVVEATVTEAAPVSYRWVYRRLAVVRRCLRGWDQLAPVLATPDEWLDHPATVFTFLQAVLEIRPMRHELRSVLESGGSLGLVSLAIVNQTVPTDTVRTLLPGQRAKLAVDWRRGRNVLEAELARLRNLHRRVPRLQTTATAIAKMFTARPILVLLFLSIAAILVAAALFLLLGNWRAAIIAVLVIPFSFLMMATGMNIFGVHFDRAATMPNAQKIISAIEATGSKAMFFNINTITIINNFNIS